MISANFVSENEPRFSSEPAIDGGSQEQKQANANE